MIKQMNGTKRYGPRAKETALRIIVLGKGRGMLSWPQGQGPFSKQTVVERKEIISSVGDGTEE
jgi:hypothetical protein